MKMLKKPRMIRPLIALKRESFTGEKEKARVFHNGHIFITPPPLSLQTVSRDRNSNKNKHDRRATFAFEFVT